MKHRVEQRQSCKDITYAPFNWQSLLDETGANLLMVSVMEQPALLQTMNNQSFWCEIYRDEVAVFYQHCGGE